MSAPILNPAFRWIPAATHSDSTAFRERQQQRMRAAEQARKANNVRAIKRAAELRDATDGRR